GADRGDCLWLDRGGRAVGAGVGALAEHDSPQPGGGGWYRHGAALSGGGGDQLGAVHWLGGAGGGVVGGGGRGGLDGLWGAALPAEQRPGIACGQRADLTPTPVVEYLGQNGYRGWRSLTASHDTHFGKITQ